MAPGMTKIAHFCSSLALEPWITCCISSFLPSRISALWTSLGPMATPVGTCFISSIVSMTAGSRLLRSFSRAACRLTCWAGWSVGSQRKRRRGLAGLGAETTSYLLVLLSDLDRGIAFAYVLGAMKLRCDYGRPVCSRCRDRDRATDCAYRPRPFKLWSESRRAEASGPVSYG